MGIFYEDMPDWLMTWIAKQHLFFVATAPKEGHVNMSPKGVDGTFHVFDSHTVWYEDMSGSGVETIAHLRDTKGRMTIMFVAFDRPPRVVRLYGTGTIHEYGTPEYDKYIPPGKRHPGSRAVIEVDIHKVGAVILRLRRPLYNYAGPRTLLSRKTAKFEADIKPDGDNFMRKYWREHLMKSIDGLPALQVAPETTSALVNVGVLEEEWGTKKSKIQMGLERYGIDARSFLAGTILTTLMMLVWMRFTLFFSDRHLHRTSCNMGSFYDEMPDWLMAWIVKQHLFFVATAPADGHVNVSPKGVEGTFHVVDPHTVWYEDLTGSIETISHLRDNGRITIMFMAIDKPPRICRLFGTGTVYEFGTPEYERYIPANKRRPGSRAVIEINIHKVGASCGYGVPFFTYAGPRTLLERVSVKFEADVKDDGESYLRKYWREHSLKSLDGLPALQIAPEVNEPLVNVGVLQEEWAGDQSDKQNRIAAALSAYGIDAKSFLAGIVSAMLFMVALMRFVEGR
ncbi:hypothetical protein EV714DRAFT_276937 [Schizophyllum commune]